MAKPSKSKVQTTSLAFFRAWLEGVEEMQGEDWTPSPEQWRRIREKIMAIEESTVQEQAPPVRAQQGFYQPPQAPMPQQSAFMPAPPMAPPMPPQSFDNHKTPDIDSTNGYTSSLV